MVAAIKQKPGTGRPPVVDGGARALGLATAGLLAVDGLGGGLAVVTGWNAPADAWGSRAVAAAPIPMMAGQVALAAAAVHWPGRRGAVAAGLLAGACGLSAVSGFFDGQFGRQGLPRVLRGVQVLLVASTLQLFVSGDHLGALNMYSRTRSAFDDESQDFGLLFASHAAVALAGAEHEANLRIGMGNRDVIGQAKGILMERHRLTAEQAFGVLARISQEMNRKLVDIARELTDTGTMPEGHRRRD